MEKRVIYGVGEELLNNLKYPDCDICLHQVNSEGISNVVCPVDKVNRRIGCKRSSKGYAQVCAEGLTARNFRIELQNVVDSIPQLMRFRKEIEKSVHEAELQKMDRIIHNIKTQNAHAIQELTNFIEPEQFAYDIKSVIPGVREKIKTKAHHAAYTILRLAKINTAMSEEIFIYDHITHKESPYQLEKRKYDIHDVLMLVFHEFMPDFSNKQVTIDVMDYDARVVFDFTVIRFIFYHLIANAEKYIKPNSVLHVMFSEDADSNIVTFLMTSYHIYSEDLDQIYNEGYSGKIAVEQKTAGQGLGMYLVNIMVKLHNAKLIIKPGEEIRKTGKISFSENEFILHIPKQTS